MKKELIAPCGMNCNICKFYYREKNKCPGCHAPDKEKLRGCRDCIVVNCEVIKTNESGFCYDCEKIPCRRLKALDKRYKTKYHMSMIGNLSYIKKQGMDAFIQKEKEKWTCPECGGIVTCHGGKCLRCGFEKFSHDNEESR